MFEGSLQDVSRMFQGSFKGVSRKIAAYSKSPLRVIQQSLKVSKKKFKGCFKVVSKMC